MPDFSFISTVQEVFNNDHAVAGRSLCPFLLSKLNKPSKALCLILNCKVHDAKSKGVKVSDGIQNFKNRFSFEL